MAKYLDGDENLAAGVIIFSTAACNPLWGISIPLVEV